MQIIEVEVKINQTVDVGVPVDDVIEAMNQFPMSRRWNFIAQIINQVEIDLSDTTDEQKAIIKKWLESRLEKL